MTTTTTTTHLTVPHHPSCQSTAAHLMHFPEELNLKPSSSPLVDDEDDDMRSLLAAAAAVAASVSPATPCNMRCSSSSGLNTPPDTVRACRTTLDDVLDVNENMEQSEHGLHTVGGAALLVSRLNSTTFVGDDLNLCLTDSPDTTTTTTTADAVEVSGSSKLPQCMVDFNSHMSPNNPSDASDAHFHLTSASSPRSNELDLNHHHHHLHLTNDNNDNPVGTIPNPSSASSHFSSVPSPEGTSPVVSIGSSYPKVMSPPTTPPQPLEEEEPDLHFNVPFSDVNQLTDAHSSPSPTSPVLTIPPQVVSHVTSSTDPSSDQKRFLTIPSINVGGVVESNQESQSAERQADSTCPSSFVHSNGFHDNFDSSSKPPSFVGEPLVMDKDSPTAETSPIHPTLGFQSGVGFCMTASVEQSNLVVTSPASVDTLSSITSDIILKLEHPQKPSLPPPPFPPPPLWSSLSDLSVDFIQKQKQPDPNTLASPVPVYSSNSPCDGQTDQISTEPERPSIVTKVETLDVTESIPASETVTMEPLETINAPIASIDEQPPLTEKIPLPQLTKMGEVFTETEYAFAAAGAVRAAVFALAGNREPDPDLIVDPALDGTGIDRIYSLSLAPVIPLEVQCAVHLDTIPYSSHSSDSPLTNGEIAHLNGVNDDATHQGHQLLTWDRGEFACSVCNRSFPQKTLLLKHRIQHEEPKHACYTCGRCFLREDKLKRHVMSIHTAEKPHVCDICNKAFSRKDKLKDHLKHHERAARNFECRQCEQLFVQKSDLNRHIRGVHQGEPGIGINMATKRRAPGASPVRLNKKKSKSLLSLGNRPIAAGSRSSVSQQQISTTIASPATTSTSVISNHSITNSTVANATCVLNLTNGTTTTTTSPMLATDVVPSALTSSIASASQLLPSSMAFTHVQQQRQQQQQHLLVQQQQQQQHLQQQAVASAFLPPCSSATPISIHQQSAFQLTQPQYFTTNAAAPNVTSNGVASTCSAATGQLSQALVATSNGPHLLHPTELKTVATPSGPMMVLTRIAAAAAANQTGQHLTAQTMFPQVVGFHPSGTAQQQQQQLQQLQQQAAVAQQQQLFQQQQQQASYAAAVAHPFHQLQQHQQVATLQQHQQHQQAAALAARQQAAAAHSFLFPSATATGNNPSFFCHPTATDGGMAAGLILASSTDPTSLAFAAAAAAAQQQATDSLVNSQTGQAAALAGLQVVAGYPEAAQQAALAHHQQQLILHHQHQQRLAVAAVAAGASVSTSVGGGQVSGVFMAAGGSNSATATNGSMVNAAATVGGVQSVDEALLRQPSQQVMLTASTADSTAAMNNCYQLAAALYQQRHPGLMLTAAGSAAASSQAAAMALHQQQQQHYQQQQQQAGLMAVYQQQQHQQAVQQQQHLIQAQVLQQQQQQQASR